MTTYSVVKIPNGVGWAWRVLASYGEGDENLRQPLYEAEADAQAAVTRLIKVRDAFRAAGRNGDE